MFQNHHFWKKEQKNQKAFLANLVSGTSPRPHRRPWIYGLGAVLSLLIVLLAFTPAFATTVTEWSGWFRVPALAHPLTTVATPAAVLYDTGKTTPGCTFLCGTVLTQYLFVRQSDSTIDFSTADRVAASSALSPVPGGGLTPSAPTAAQLGHTLYLFVQGTDNVVWVNRFDGTAWHSWTQLHVGSTSSLVPTQNGPHVTVYQGAMFLFVRASDGSIDVTRTADGTTWTNLSEVPGGGHTPSTPTAAVFGNTLYAMVQGPDNLVWINTFDGVAWSGWSRPLGDGAGFIPTSTSPIAGYDGDGELHLIVRFSDGSIQESVTSDGTAWRGVSELPTTGRTPSALAVMALPPVTSGLFVFAQGTDNTVYENDFEVIAG